MPKLCPTQAHSGAFHHTPAHEAVASLLFKIKHYLAAHIRSYQEGDGIPLLAKLVGTWLLRVASLISIHTREDVVVDGARLLVGIATTAWTATRLTVKPRDSVIWKDRPSSVCWTRANWAPGYRKGG